MQRIVAAHPDQVVAAFAHGGIIGEMLSQACGASGFSFAPDNTGISQLVVMAERWVVRRYNDTGHLKVPLVTAGSATTR